MSAYLPMSRHGSHSCLCVWLAAPFLLCMQELKKKELEELEAVLSELGIDTNKADDGAPAGGPDCHLRCLSVKKGWAFSGFFSRKQKAELLCASLQ